MTPTISKERVWPLIIDGVTQQASGMTQIG
jgi:hypothetical protein